MITILQYIAFSIWILGGLFMVLLGFDVIKLKNDKATNQQKNATLLKLLGIVLLLLGIFKFTILLFNP